MTAASPDPRLRRLARLDAFKRAAMPGASNDAAGDRVFVTLLSLNFMLLAFFVVLGTTASFDRTQARTVAENVRIAFSGASDTGKTRTAILSARQALQTGVSEALADVLPSVNRFYIDNSDRIDVDIPVEKFSDVTTDPERDSIYDGVAHLLQAAPSGFRYALLVSGGDSPSPISDAASRFAGALVERGVAPQDLLVGSGGPADGRLHMSFLVFEGESDDAEPWSAGIVAARPPAEVEP